MMRALDHPPERLALLYPDQNLGNLTHAVRAILETIGEGYAIMDEATRYTVAPDEFLYSLASDACYYAEGRDPDSFRRLTLLLNGHNTREQ